MFRHQILFYRARKKLNNVIKLLIDLVKKRFNLLLDAQSFISGTENVIYVYGDINCNLKIRFSDIDKSFLQLENMFPEQLVTFYLFLFLEVIFIYHYLSNILVIIYCVFHI